MSTQVIDCVATTSAPREALWQLLGTSSTWPSWTPIESHTTIRPGGDDGLGEVRAFRTGRVEVREEIVERRPDERLTYVLLSGLAVKDYRAEIDLVSLPDGRTEMPPAHDSSARP